MNANAAPAAASPIRAAQPADFAAILALNADAVRFTSALDEARLRRLHEQAAWHRVVERDGAVAGFLLALREGADYDSANYRWFAARYPRFLYIDRVVVGAALRGCGVGARLYDDILAFAQASAISPLTCEFDLDPPNPASERFHARHGFREVGRQRLPSGKQVSLQARAVEAGGA